MKNFITTALPYANGDLHWGHFFEAVIADIYSKHKKIPLISGDDQHGAAITLFVEKNQLNINEHLLKQYNNHCSQYKTLGIDFSYFGKTHSLLHENLVLFFYQKLLDKNLIFSKKTISWFDCHKNQFLPDRYVRGTCPHCGKENVYPHVCEYCNQYFEADKLLNPISVLSNTSPVLKETEHYFLNSSKFYENLEHFCNELNIHHSAKKKILDSSLKALNEIDITRDLPYFGIKLPNKNLAFYVWFDAPLAYLSFILEHLSIKNPSLSFDDLIDFLKDINLEHVIGKDITYFHTFFWLNLLKILDLPLPKKLHVHGWIVQKNGEKYSKSNGDKLDLNVFSPKEIDAIRLYFCSIYDKSIQDNEFSLESSYELYNQFIVGKFVNIYSRITKILSKNNILVIHLSISQFNYENKIINELNDFHLKNALKLLFTWIDDVNQYIQFEEPWKIDNQDLLINVCSKALSEFKLISYYIGLICPNLNNNLKSINYSDIQHTHLTHKIT